MIGREVGHLYFGASRRILSPVEADNCSKLMRLHFINKETEREHQQNHQLILFSCYLQAVEKQSDRLADHIVIPDCAGSISFRWTSSKGQSVTDILTKGDLKYGAERSNKNGSIHLHAQKLTLEHPVKRENITFS